MLLLLCPLRLGFCLDRLFARALTSFLFMCLCSGNEETPLKFSPHDDIEDKDYHDVNVNDGRIIIALLTIVCTQERRGSCCRSIVLACVRVFV